MPDDEERCVIEAPRLMMIYFQGQVPHATSVSRRLRAYLVVKKVRICRL